MFLDARLLFIYTETPLHAGGGTGLGAVDLPIQRERITGYPIVQASGIKGALRSEAEPNNERDSAEKIAVFGPMDAEHAGALSTGDARILLFPVRSLKGVFAWTTSLDVLERFRREALTIGLNNMPVLPKVQPDSDQAYSSGNAVVADKAVVLEEFAFDVIDDPEVNQQSRQLAEWLANNALPSINDVPAYEYWQKKLLESLIILPNDAFRDFVLHATEVVTRVRLEADTKSVIPGALWTQENLPVDSLLYTPVYATRLRMINGQAPTAWANLDSHGQAKQVLEWIASKNNIPHRFQLGGDETVGRGLVRLRWIGG